MNTTSRTDFFPEIDERNAHLVAPDIHQPYQDTEEDLLHEQRLREVDAIINERLGESEPADGWGELPYDEEADRKRWDELENDFDRVFQDAARYGVN